MSPVAHEDAGVRRVQVEGDRLHELMQRTFGERVLARPGQWGALFSLDYDEKLFRHNYAHPVLVSAVGGLGAKLRIASMAGRHDTVGMELVAVCVNEVLTVGAEPLFFLDYLAAGRLDSELVRQVIEGVVAGCNQAGCALLGGKTAEMSGPGREGAYDLAGFVVGVVESRRLVTGGRIRPGDAVVGLPSDGLHCGPEEADSLVQRLFFDEGGMQCRDSLARFGIERSLGEELLVPTRMYVRAVRAVLRRYTVKHVVAGIAHVSGKGLLESICGILSEGCAVELDSSSWGRPAIFGVIQQLGGMSVGQMYRTFNMGVGMVLVVAPYYAQSVVRQLRREGEEAVVIGRVTEGPREVTVV